MMTTDAIDTADIAAIDHDEAMSLQETELARGIDQLRSLSDQEWAAPTDCPEWDVRAMWLHVLGACAAGASHLENGRQLLAAYRRRRADGTPLEAGLSANQIESRQHLRPAELMAELDRIAPAAIAGRRRLPRLARKVTIAVDAPVVERWSLGYLTDIIYLRDLWMHRVDTARAVGATLELDAAHDGRIVADVVAEWARRHGEPFILSLTGPAGGRFASGSGGTELELDAVEFCRLLSGRGAATGLLTQTVPF